MGSDHQKKEEKCLPIRTKVKIPMVAGGVVATKCLFSNVANIVHVQVWNFMTAFRELAICHVQSHNNYYMQTSSVPPPYS